VKFINYEANSTCSSTDDISVIIQLHSVLTVSMMQSVSIMKQVQFSY